MSHAQLVGESPCPAVEEQTDSQLLKRFCAQRDEHAFRTLVQRHGPMVRSVCRRVLNDSHAADDAFQATFLVLVRKCNAIGRPELLGNWLFGVAYRIAVRARANAARRRDHERRAATMPRVQPPPDITWRELRTVLDDEIHRLPDKYRAPLVLCYLEGKTNEEAADELGWPSGSMSRRLARARELLRSRLVRRGLTLSAGLLLVLLGQSAEAGVPDSLAESTVHVAVLTAAGKAGPGVVSASVAAMTRRALRDMSLARWRFAAAIALAVLLLLGGTGSVASKASGGGWGFKWVQVAAWFNWRGSGDGQAAPKEG